MEASCFAFDPERPGSICIKKPERDTRSVLRALFHSDIRERNNAHVRTKDGKIKTVGEFVAPHLPAYALSSEANT
jgi:hypothetical protein